MDHLEAKRKLQDQMYLAMLKGGWRWGWRLGVFVGTFTLISNTIAVYRNKSGILEYATAGTITGGFFKFSMGPKGMIAGAVAGQWTFYMLLS